MKRNWKGEFASRYRRHQQELERLYAQLYHSDTKSFDDFQQMLYTCWEQRPESMKALDRIREGHTEWYENHGLVGMQMYVESFAGTLKGVKRKLPYIADAGVNYLHLMPLLKSPQGHSDGGYAVSDYRCVQPELGTMEDLLALAEECHARRMMLCLDFVMNHTSDEHEWAIRAKAGDQDCQDKYFFYDSWEIPNAYEQTVPQVFPSTAPGNFSWCAEAGKVVMTTFHPYQWDLNYMNPVVFRDMTENMMYLCNHGADVIRLDAIPYIWKALGTSCRNLPQVHTLVRMMRIACEIVCPGTLLLGEVVMEPDKVAPYFGSRESPECHMLYNVTTMATIWHTVATRDVRLLANQLQQVFALPKEYTFLNYLRCHDDIGWGLNYDLLRQFGQEQVPHKRYLNDYLTGVWPGSPARGELYNQDLLTGDARLCGTTASLCGIETARKKDDPQALALALQLDETLHAFMFTLSGVPVLYSGDEIAQENDYSYHEDPMKQEDSRFLHRGAMDWEKAKLRKKKTSVEGRLFAALKQMEQLRAAHVAFDSKADVWLLNGENDHVLGIGRYAQGEKVLALFNFADEEQSVWIREQENYSDLLTGKPVDIVGLRLPPKSFRWLVHQF